MTGIQNFELGMIVGVRNHGVPLKPDLDLMTYGWLP